MPRAIVTLGIGYPTASHKDVIDIDDEEWAECETEEQRDDLLSQYWIDWSNNYIEGDIRVLDDE